MPEATERVEDGVAGFKYRGKPLAYIGETKRHCGLYGMDASGLEDALAAYDMPKGTMHFVPPQTCRGASWTRCSGGA